VAAPYAVPMGSQSANVHALQVEALKKLRLLQCIALGGPQPLPKYANQNLNKFFKSTPYNALVYNFPLGKPGAPASSSGSSAQQQDPAQGQGQIQTTNPLLSQALKDRELYVSECNWGLVERLARHAAPRWALKRLTETYVTLGLREIARHLAVFFDGEAGSGGVEEVRALVLSMIDEGMIRASISDGGEDGGIVTFFDEFDEVNDEDNEDEVRELGQGVLALKEEQLRVLLGVSVPAPQPPALVDLQPMQSKSVKIQIQTLLAAVQSQSEQLAALDREFEKSKEFLAKANKMERSGGGGPICK
jgi:COP9 signalosome complex subunit 3